LDHRYFPFYSVGEALKTSFGGVIAIVLGILAGCAAAGFCLPDFRLGASLTKIFLINVEAVLSGWGVLYVFIVGFMFFGALTREWRRVPVFLSLVILQLTVVLIQTLFKHGFSPGIIVKAAIVYLILFGLLRLWYAFYRQTKTAGSLFRRVEKNFEPPKKL